MDTEVDSKSRRPGTSLKLQMRSNFHPPEPRRLAARSPANRCPSFSPDRAGAAGGAANKKLKIFRRSRAFEKVLTMFSGETVLP